jgi:zinc transport system substrate-binding protein
MAIIAAALLSACGPATGTADDRSAGADIQVLASFYPLQFVAQQVAGDHANVANLTPPAAEPHDLELSPASAQRISSADVVVTLSGFQPAVDDAIAERHPAHLVDAANIVELLPASVTGAADLQGASSDVLDPHFWLDPTELAALAQPVADALTAADPQDAELYSANAAALVARLTELDAQFQQQLAPFAGATFITSHTSFGYLAARYGLVQIGVTGLDPEAEPSPARMREITNLIREHGVTTLFYETLASPQVIETLASDLGLSVGVLNTLEGLRQDDIDTHQDYLTIMQHNLTALTEGLSAP